LQAIKKQREKEMQLGDFASCKEAKGKRNAARGL
jgi:hypothetical protein